MHADCQLCESMNAQNALSHNDTCLLQYDAEVNPQGCAIVSPLRQVSLVFDLSPSEWEDTYPLLMEAKVFFDKWNAPDGYNVGWNHCTVAGQEIDHVRLLVIPRSSAEPLAGREIRYRLKQPNNRRRSGLLDDTSSKTLMSKNTCSFVTSGERRWLALV